jgi:hypothetical protein
VTAIKRKKINIWQKHEMERYNNLTKDVLKTEPANNFCPMVWTEACYGEQKM